MARRLPASLIVACSVNRVIGKQGKLPWNLPADWSFFSSATRCQVLVVGRRSFEEFDEPILNRHTIVVSSTLKQPMQAEVEGVGGRWSGVQVARTLEEALWLADSHPQYQDCTRVFIGGGEGLYKEAMAAEVAESCYVTRVQRYVAGGDTHFPKWTAQFPNLMYSAKTSGGGGTRLVSLSIGTTGDYCLKWLTRQPLVLDRVSFEIWGSRHS
jgi:dihydrofolate reductase